MRVYFYAAILFGFAPALLGSITWFLLKGRTRRFARSAWIAAGIPCGALAGAVVMTLVALAFGERAGSLWSFRSTLAISSFIGLISGAFSGLLIGLYLPSIEFRELSRDSKPAAA